MRLHGHIAAVESLNEASNDDEAMCLGAANFIARIEQHFDGFEIWDKARKNFSWPAARLAEAGSNDATNP